MDFRTLEERGWNDPAVTSLYEAGFVRVTSRTIDPLLDAARVASGHALLDLACGPGPVSAAAARRGAVTVGVDFSPAMLERARAAHPELHFERGDAGALPFPPERFDAVVCNYGLLHFDRPERALAETARVLRPEGRAGFAVWTEAAVLFQLIPSTIRQLGFDPRLPPGPAYFQFGQEGGLSSAFEAVGLVPDPPRTIAWTARLGSAEEFWTMFERGSVRTRASLEGLAPDERRQLRGVVDQRLSTYEQDGGLEVPVEAVVGAAQKPPARE